MSKINVDTDLIGKELIPLASDELKNINNALQSAQSVTLPDGDYSWKNVISELSDCSNLASKYNEWINRIQTKYNNKINDSIEDISSIKIEDMLKRLPIVK